MPVCPRYEPPMAIMFQKLGGVLAFGWACYSGQKAGGACTTGTSPSTANCSMGYLASTTCGAGCDNVGTGGCSTGYNAKASCSTGSVNPNPNKTYCSGFMGACCSGLSGVCGTGSTAGYPVNCTNGNIPDGTCVSGTDPCDSCISKMCSTS